MLAREEERQQRREHQLQVVNAPMCAVRRDRSGRDEHHRRDGTTNNTSPRDSGSPFHTATLPRTGCDGPVGRLVAPPRLISCDDRTRRHSTVIPGRATVQVQVPRGGSLCLQTFQVWTSPQERPSSVLSMTKRTRETCSHDSTPMAVGPRSVVSTSFRDVSTRAPSGRTLEPHITRLLV